MAQPSFQRGGVSFTYYFLAASHHTFCPDTSRRANKIRDIALDIGLRLLTKDKMDTDAVRYFSRASMLGRINMTDLWKGFSPLAETQGNPIIDDDIQQRIRDHDYEFLYSFVSYSRKTFQVVRVGDKKYTIGVKNQIFGYRNPHNFRYFVEK